ncbi:MAG: 50S ribosomal protein L29 [Saprospiraceae bacterium]|nr:50S ribosomal protein L29 [Saprospiraceae bacterium]MBK8449324.1 50S ribosomal protein L29 [Saprospiraceae bacterium]MBK8484605.1 50S ribosomal protein L29 [Saprospiraceae bacterium]MBK9222033.1 50S ribosomal protein L29 [Saprospiraceae bacterium]MBK9721057.1 50S ribosomal protein L29 [Saprospiraceae bacterium]
MALKKYSEFTDLSQEILERDLLNAITQLHSLKLEHKVKGLQNPTQIRFLRKEVAMMKTELTKRTSTQS